MPALSRATCQPSTADLKSLRQLRQSRIRDFPHDIEQNRKTLETCARYWFEQGLSTRPVALDEVFAEPTMAF